jgi:hypothetical protein
MLSSAACARYKVELETDAHGLAMEMVYART